MRDYELTVVFKGDLGEKELDKEVGSLQAHLLKENAKIKTKNDPERKPLAYEIKGQKEGFYLYLEVSLDPVTIAKIDAKLKTAENVIRYLLVKSPKSKVKSLK